MKKNLTLTCKKFLVAFLLLITTYCTHGQSTNVVISQIYGAGGNSGAAYNYDYVELFNPTTASITMTNWSVQYASSTGTSYTASVFSGTIPAGGYFLIRLGTGSSAVGTAIPTPDAIPTAATNISGTTGKIALCTNSTALAVSCPTGGAIIDFVGFGTGNCFETAVAPAPSSANAIFRANNGCTDSNNNSTDFSAAAAAPRNSSTPLAPCVAPPTATTSAATAITTTGATLNGSVNAKGNSTTVTFGYGLTTSYGSSATAAQSPVTGSSATTVNASVSSLSVNTLYNFRVQATSTAGTTNGSNLTFYTLANVPDAPTVNTPTANSLTVSVNANSNPASTEFAIQETGGNYVQANGTLGASAVWQTATTWGSKVVTGLSASTTYTFQVKARNGSNIETAFSATAAGTTSAATSPTLNVTGTVAAFSSLAGTPSFSKNFSLTGVNLTDTVFLAAPSNFQITLDTNSWSSSLFIIPSSGSVSSLVYVRMNAATEGSYSGNVAITSVGATAVNVPLTGVAVALEPTVQSSVSASSITSSSATVTLSGGNGASRIVVASTSAVTYVPSDGATISGVNSNFTSATDQGSGNKVVYSGSGNSFTLNGISANTTYYLASYEFNGSGVTSNYYTVTPGTTNFTTLIAAPTVASTVTVTRVKLDSLVLSFTGGNGTSRLVVLAEGGAVTFTPTTGTSYSGINNNFSLATDQGSNNRIVYSGSGTSVAVLGLNRNTLYGIKVIEFNGSGSTSSYFITAGGTASQTTPGYVAYATALSTYSQNFNTLPSSGLTTALTGFGSGPYFLNGPPVNSSSVTGWQYANQLSGDVRISTDNGGSSTGSVMIYGTTSSSERALGVLASSAVLGAFGVTFENTSGVPLYTASVTFDGEQWRNGGSGGPNQLKMQYSIGSGNILNGTWTDVTNLTYSSTTVSTTAAALDGNAGASPLTGSFTLNGSWAPGQTLSIRWLDVNEAGNDDGVAIDNFTFSAAPAAAPTQQDSMLSFTSVLTTSMTANWMNGNGSGRIVVMNTSNSFTNPANATAYSANSVYSGSGEQVVYNGSGSSVNITGLTAGTTYYFRVFAYNGAGVSLSYATQTATDNPSSQTTTSVFPPTALTVLNVNNGNPVFVNQPFTVTIQSIDAGLNPQPVLTNTTVDLTLGVGNGLLYGTTSGTITAGTSTVTITGVLYDTPETDIQLNADATAGDVLTGASTSLFTVYDVATFLDFTALPSNVVSGVTSPLLQVSAFRSDFTVDQFYTGNITLTKVSGPGTITGTLTKAAVAGVAGFNDLVFSAPGSYVVQTSSGSLTTANTTIVVTAPVVMNELVVPKYFGSKTTASVNNNRTPVIACISFDNLLPNTTYNLAAGLALSSEASTAMGAGTIWNGTSFTGSTLNSAFTSNGSGSSGPVWIALQPSGNSTRFGAGDIHVIRLALSTATFSGTINAQFSTTNTLTALDIATTALSVATTDDGAFVVGKSDTCMSGRFAIAYDNASGTGQPLSVGAITTHGYPNGSQTGLPGAIDSAYANTAAKGSYGFVIPIGANSSNGVRYVEIRNAANAVVNSIADADGIWPSGANTTTQTRLSVVRLTSADVSLNTLTSLSVTGTNVTCFQGNDGSATATAISLSPSINYTWSGNQTTAAITNLTAGNYTVLAVDGFGCAKSGSVSITQPAQISVSASNNGPQCIGDTVILTATGGVSYSWSGPDGFTATGSPAYLISNNISNAGTYSVLVTNASGCTNTATTTVSLTDCSCTPPVLTSSTTNACVNTATGSVDLTVTGGIAPFNYVWSNGATTQDISNLLPGTYTVSVTDSVSCNAQLQVTVGNTVAPVITAGGATTFCTGGSVTLTASAGSAYLWSTGATTQSIVATTTGSYNVSVTNGTCTASATAIPVTVNNYSFTGNIYAENFGAPSGTVLINSYTQYQNSAPIAYNAGTTGTDVRITTVSTTYSGASGGANVFFGTSGGNLKTLTISGINTQGSTGLTLSFGLLRSDVTGVISIEVSSDGTNYTALTATMPASANTWTLVTCGGTIPATSNLYIRFSKNSTTSFRLDDIKLTATTTSLVSSASGPLTVCGAGSVYLSANIASGVTWSTGATTRSIQVSATGSYTYSATGSNGCPATSTPVSFTVNPEPTGSATAGTILCNGGSTTVTVGASGGIGPYTGTGTFTVSAGTYSYILTDVTGCDDTVSVTVTQPAVLVATATPGTISCNGGTTTITVSATGGTPTYTGTGTFTVSAGPYSYTVTDANGCTATVSGTITEPSVLSASATAGTISCNGGSTSVVVSATGGTPSYTGIGTFTASAGAYSYTVTDSKGCTAIASGTITQPTALVASASAGTISCNGGTTSVVVSATGGTPSYSGTGTFTVSAGPYSYTVTDANGCTAVASGTITEPTALLASATAGTISCNGGTTTIFVSATGGTPTYAGTGTFTVSAGPYSYTVTDANGCTAVASGTITEPDPLSITSFTPASGIAGTVVTVTGTGFSNVVEVGLGNISSSPTVFTVTEEVKDNTHPYFGLGSAHGFVLNGVQGPELTFVRGVTYTFNINTIGHPLVITTSPEGGASNSSFELTNGVVNNYTMNGTLTFTPDNSTPSLVYYNCGIHSYMGYKINIVDAPVAGTYVVDSPTQITFTVPAGATTNPIYIITSCDTVQSVLNFNVLPSVTNLDLTVFVQGYYMGSGQMAAAIYNQGVSTDPMETDTITVELHADTSPYAMVYTASAVLGSNGDASFNFPPAASGNSYYIVVKGRNTVEVWSKAPVLFGTITSYDFTVPSAPRPAGSGNQGSNSGPSQTH